MSDEFKHHRIRFSLKWLLIAVGAIAPWLGWNIYQVRQRGRMEQYVASRPSRFESKPARIFYGDPGQPRKSLPIMWRLLGVKSVQIINLRGYEMPEEDRTQIRAWFPEAEIRFDAQ
jgi:hypothetical protein